MKRGRCELCHVAADLHDSHYLPKSGYRKMRASELKNPNPVVLAGGKAQQSSLQVRDYKFCGACEERFNKGGEAWILNKIPQNYGDPFWLHALLSSKTPIKNGDDLLFSQASIPEVDMAKLVYFALSIFWRGTRSWSAVQGGRPEKLYLGRQEKVIRAFLLGRGKLPEDVAITCGRTRRCIQWRRCPAPMPEPVIGATGSISLVSYSFSRSGGRFRRDSGGPARITLPRSS
jgi:hypothetical protein